MAKMSMRFHAEAFIKCSVFVIIISITGISSSLKAQQVSTAKGNSAVSTKTIDNGYFKYEVTGNEARDMEAYKTAKERFVHDYPEKYKAMLADPNLLSKHTIDKAEFEKMPASKKAEILAHPEKYQIQ
jgi:hypothetical protein